MGLAPDVVREGQAGEEDEALVHARALVGEVLVQRLPSRVGLQPVQQPVPHLACRVTYTPQSKISLNHCRFMYITKTSSLFGPMVVHVKE
jgi:hypothetical protein